MLVALAVICALAALAALRVTRDADSRRLKLPRRAPLIALVVICAGLALAIVAGAKESSATQPSARRRALRNAAEQPLRLLAGRLAACSSRSRSAASAPAAGRWPGCNSARSTRALRTPIHCHYRPPPSWAWWGWRCCWRSWAGVALAARRAHRLAPELAAGPVAGLWCTWPTRRWTGTGRCRPSLWWR